MNDDDQKTVAPDPAEEVEEKTDGDVPMNEPDTDSSTSTDDDSAAESDEDDEEAAEESSEEDKEEE